MMIRKSGSKDDMSTEARPEDVAMPDEQRLCTACGLCCDGTLFRRAKLGPGERLHVPEKIAGTLFTENEVDYFRLPCWYFDERCTIYNESRPPVCGSFRCLLLKEMTEGKITLGQALDVVAEARQMRDRLLDRYRQISGKSDILCFRDLLEELGHIRKKLTGNEPESADYEVLLAECNIFEALMIKQIRSEEEFERIKSSK